MSINLDKCIEQLMRCEMLSEATVKEICDKMKEQLIDEANIVHLKAPVTIVGDIHGQFYDLLEIFKIGGKCPDTNYLFLGDYIDRGYFGVETISLLTCLKLRYPHRITLLRGSHESRPITQVYGFYGECLRKYGNANVWKYFTDMFDYLTIAAIVDERIFCVHGGLSPSITSLDQIRVINRFQEISPDSPIADLMWSDPDPERDGYNASQRGAGYSFGQNTINNFLKTNKIETIVRGHQLCMDGYQTLFNGKISTIWSAPNYCNRCGNIASILEISENLDKYFNTFSACPDSERQKPSFDSLKEIPDYYL